MIFRQHFFIAKLFDKTQIDHHQGMGMKKFTNFHPNIITGIGKSIQETKQNSIGYPFDSNTFNNGNLTINEPVILIISHNNQSIRYPVSDRVEIRAINDHVHNIIIKPHLSSLTLKETCDVIDDIYRLVARTSWQQQHQPRDFLENIESYNDGFTQLLCDWVLDKTHMSLFIKRTFKAGGHSDNNNAFLDHDQYVLEISVINYELQPKLFNKASGKK